jgi:hypothetical protein
MPGYRRWCGERLSNLSPQHSRFEDLLLPQTAHPNLRDNARLQHRTRNSQVFKLDRVRPSVVADRDRRLPDLGPDRSDRVL